MPTSGPGTAERADVVVVGAGLAGLHTATRLAELGHDVLLAERRADLAGAIRTTGIFVRRTLEDFPLPADLLGPPIRRVVLYPPGLRRPVTLVSARDEYRVGDMAPLYLAAARNATAAGVRLALGTRYLGRQGNTFWLAGPAGPTGVRARFVVGADGALQRFRAIAPGLRGVGQPEQVERRGGPIPVGGLLRRISCADGLLVGDAAGAVSPLTAGGLDPCLRLSDLAAAVDDALRAGRPDLLAHYDGAGLRARFRGRLALRWGLAQVRTPTAAAAAFTLMRTPFGQAAARRILFGDRSFPTPARTAASARLSSA